MSTPFKPTTVNLPDPQSKTDAIVGEIRRWIFTEQLQPGDRLIREKDLIELFHASRGSVREALKALQHQGLIRIKPGVNGGAEVASMSHERTSRFLRNYFYFHDLTWAQIYDLRRQIEPRLARDVTGLLDDDDLAALEASIRECEAHRGADGDLRALRQAEIDFHAVLAARCPNPLTRFICHFLNDLMRELTVTKNIVDPGGERFSDDNIAAHKALIAALSAGDADAAEACMTEHIERAGCYVCAREGKVDARVLL